MFLGQVRYAIRSLFKSRSITITAIATLALGIGANTALFTVMNAVILRPMNYPHSERIVELTRSFDRYRVNAPSATAAKFDFWSKTNHSFEAVAAHNIFPLGVNLSGKGEPKRIRSLAVSAEFFRVLGVQPQIGRSFTASEDTPGAGYFAVISDALWQRLFQGDRDVIGQALTLNSASYTILGVMPANFDFPQAADVWTPLRLKIDPSDRANNYAVVARLKPGISLQQAAQDMQAVGRNFRRQFGAAMDEQESVGVVDFHQWIVGDVRPMLLVLMSAVGFVLLIACSNVANLLLARSTARQHEIAVRSALGASGRQLMGMIITESLLLSLAGGALGVLLAQYSLPMLLQLAPVNLPSISQIQIEWSVLVFAIAISMMAGLLFGIFPALQSTRLGDSNSLREAGIRTTASVTANRARQLLVIAEVAISFVLLIGAGLLVATVKNLGAVNPGFDTRHVLTTQMSLSDERFRTTEATAALADRVVKRLEAMPGVVSVATISALPTQIGFDNPFEIVGRPASGGMLDELMRVVTPHYFAAMHIPVVAGRSFTELDTQKSRGVIIVNEAFARKYFRNENPIGQQILVGRVMGPIFADVVRQVVGVVGDTRDAGLNRAPEPIFFEPVAQLPDKLMAMDNQLSPANWIVRTTNDPLAMAEHIRRETLIASGGVPIAEPRLLEQVIGSSIARQRFTMTLLGLFAFMAILLAAIGLYGVISYSVAQRTRELGIRAALGAARNDLLKLVIGEGMWLAGFGIAAGFLLAAGLTHFLKSMLFGVTAFDPVVLLGMACVLGIVSLAACWFPAHRAARVDPAIALREQ